MSILAGREPQRVLYYFEKICSIPHGSRNERMISDYLVDFARERNLTYRQDDMLNVIIWKDGSPGYEDAAPVILQGHMDMVAVKEEGVSKDMETEGLDLALDGDMLYAKGTSLGGDNGIAVAYMLTILDDDTMEHPPIEAVFTTGEEIGLLGATHLDTSDLSGKTFINLDSETEGIFIVNCAGGTELELSFDCDRDAGQQDSCRLELQLKGLKGGHSGQQINKGRLNAIKAMGRLLYGLSRSMDIRLVSIDGGEKDNVIAPSCEAVITISDDRALALVRELFDRIKEEYIMVEPGISLSVIRLSGDGPQPMSPDATRSILRSLIIMPTGVLRMNPDLKDMVQTSANLGVIRTREDQVTMIASVRSASESEEAYQVERVRAMAEGLAGSLRITASYPGWQYKRDSRIRDVMREVYRNIYGQEPLIEGIHAGLECGIFMEKMPDLDMISVGPDMTGIHSPAEKLDLASVKRTYDLIVATLKELR